MIHLLNKLFVWRSGCRVHSFVFRQAKFGSNVFRMGDVEIVHKSLCSQSPIKLLNRTSIDSLSGYIRAKLYTGTAHNKPVVTGFIVVDLETDGLITNSEIPQILQIGFAPLEKLAHPNNTVSFYTQPADAEAFRKNLNNSPYLEKFYTSYFNGSYFLKREGGSDTKVDVIPLDEGILKLIKWKRETYQDRPVYLIAHNALKFDKIILEHYLEKLKVFDSFISEMSLLGWIDSLSIVRKMSNILNVLGHPRMAYANVNRRMWLIKKKRPFALENLVQALAIRYAGLSESELQWPIFDLSYLNRGEEKWLHTFSPHEMIHSNRDLLKQLRLHRSGDDVMALICIIHQLNLYPEFLEML